jgi:uncharacterized membrane protein
MTFYELVLFGHILAAAIWFGAGLLFHVLAHRADRARDTVAMRRLLDDTVVLSNQLFIPASMTVLLAGLLLVIDGPWSFGELWIVLGLLGFAATTATGVLVIKPRSERIGKLTPDSGGGLTAEAVYEARRMLAIARIDYVTLVLVFAVMAFKPTGDDVALLLVLAAVLVAGAAFIYTRAQAVQAPVASSSASA